MYQNELRKQQFALLFSPSLPMSSTSQLCKLNGMFNHKIDSACRLALPADWRKTLDGEELSLSLSKDLDVPVLRLVTSRRHDEVIEKVRANPALNEQQKSAYLASISEKLRSVSLNTQNKLSIPKDLLLEGGFSPQSEVVLCGRPEGYADIFTPDNYALYQAARAPMLEQLLADANLPAF